MEKFVKKPRLNDRFNDITEAVHLNSPKRDAQDTAEVRRDAGYLFVGLTWTKS